MDQDDVGDRQIELFSLLFRFGELCNALLVTSATKLLLQFGLALLQTAHGKLTIALSPRDGEKSLGLQLVLIVWCRFVVDLVGIVDSSVLSHHLGVLLSLSLIDINRLRNQMRRGVRTMK